MLKLFLLCGCCDEYLVIAKDKDDVFQVFKDTRGFDDREVDEVRKEYKLFEYPDDFIIVVSNNTTAKSFVTAVGQRTIYHYGVDANIKPIKIKKVKELKFPKVKKAIEEMMENDGSDMIPDYVCAVLVEERDFLRKVVKSFEHCASLLDQAGYEEMEQFYNIINKAKGKCRS